MTNDEGHREIRIVDGREKKGRSVFKRSDTAAAADDNAQEARRKRGSSRKYALYWDQTDDPNYIGAAAAAAASGEHHNRRHQQRPVEDHGRSATESAVGDEQGAATSVHASSPYRRKRFDDLKSMQQRKKEADEADQAFNYGWVDY